MTEREKKPGEGGKEQEHQPSYIDARRYPNQETAARAYMEGQQVLKKEAGKTDVSIFRLQFGPQLISHVVTLGQTHHQPCRTNWKSPLVLESAWLFPTKCYGIWWRDAEWRAKPPLGWKGTTDQAKGLNFPNDAVSPPCRKLYQHGEKGQ
jgi:hypothetical protein